MRMSRYLTAGLVATVTLLGTTVFAAAQDVLSKIGVKRGIVAVLGIPARDPQSVIDLTANNELTFYFQTPDAGRAAAVRAAAEAAGLLSRRLFVDTGQLDSIHLANNVADCILVAASVAEKVSDQELLRALRPRATAYVGDRRLVKPVPSGIDDWSHPYHGPDNNPQSNDRLVRGQFRTQFLSDPKFSPMPQQTVAAGGRLYKAMGHIAHKANQNAMLNTLFCINAYNGSILWKRPVSPGFMFHRNTMIATDDALYVGDHESCKIIDAVTGQVRDQITIPEGLSDGPVWKWMALQDGVLFALVGNPEIKVETQKSTRRGLGHWPWGMWKGHDYKDPRTAFGFGRTFLAIDVKTRQVLWSYRDGEFLDARGVCMSGNRIFFFSPGLFLGCLDRDSGSLLWKNSDKDLLDAIAPNAKAQHYVTGYATTCYIKCNEDYVFFAGPQRPKLVAASAADGKLVWTHPTGNLQLVLRPDGLYAAGPQRTTGVRLDYATGEVLASFPARRACTRATGCADSIFYRASGGTVRVLTESNTAQHIAPMRPPCQDGVIVSNGHLYWGPWMCGCQLSLYGNICLAPAPTAVHSIEQLYQDARQVGSDVEQITPLEVHAHDWTSYRANNARSDVTENSIPADVALAWSAEVCRGSLPTAPVVAGGLVFVADRTGAIRALGQDGRQVWKSYTSGPIYYPPAIAHNRVYVGSADGRVYAFEAATGRSLWSFRVAPQDRWIPVYGKLISTWPVAGGVVVEEETVYAAAGIAHYDGTYVVALNAITGQLKAHNASSGTLSQQVDSGVSMQGNLMIADGELRFLAGGVYETARYDLKTLACLNEPKVQVTSQFRTAFYPYYPSYGKYVSLEYACGDGNLLCHDASYEGNLFSNLALQSFPPGVARQKKEAARWTRRRGKQESGPKKVWQDKVNRRFTSFVVSGDRLLASGHPEEKPDESFLVAVNIEDGSDAWAKELPAEAVKGGTAVDPHGRIYVSLENGRLLCFEPRSE